MDLLLLPRKETRSPAKARTLEVPFTVLRPKLDSVYCLAPAGTILFIYLFYSRTSAQMNQRRTCLSFQVSAAERGRESSRGNIFLTRTSVSSRAAGHRRCIHSQLDESRYQVDPVSMSERASEARRQSFDADLNLSGFCQSFIQESLEKKRRNTKNFQPQRPEMMSRGRHHQLL